MAKKTELDEPAVYYIPSNFITKGTVLGGTIKTRNLIDAIVILLLIGYPVSMIPMNLTVKIVILACTCLPLAVWAIIGVNDGPLSQFLVDFIKFKKFPQKYEYDLKHLDKKPESEEPVKGKKKQKKSKKKKGGDTHEKE